MRTVLLALLVIGCKAKPDNGEAAYVEKELASLQKSLADESESGITVDCVGLETSLPRMSKDLAARIEKGCYVDGPKILIRKAIAHVKANKLPPELADLGCMELFGPDAVVVVDKHPTQDAELLALVDELTKLCPKDVEKARAKKKP